MVKVFLLILLNKYNRKRETLTFVLIDWRLIYCEIVWRN